MTDASLICNAIDGNLHAIIQTITYSRVLGIEIDTSVLREALTKAAANGHLDVVKYLVKTGRISISKTEEPSLYFAAGNGHFDVVKYLLECGTYHLSAVHSAATNGFIEIAMYIDNYDYDKKEEKFGQSRKKQMINLLFDV
jgi:ankyrin repeat protein